MVNGGTPPEVHIDAELVRSLLRAQRPDLAGLPVVPFANGWDNEMFALGDDLLVRLPRRSIAADLVVNEQTWLPVLSPHLPLGVPAPVHAGTPAGDYPWHWSVVPRFAGGPAATAPQLAGTEEATRLAQFLRALHVPAPQDAPQNPFRGGTIESRTDSLRVVKSEFPATKLGYDYFAIEHIWFWAEDGPQWDDEPVWLHGDLHAGNIIVDGGRISAIVDWGDICSGDPACDLAVAWMLFEEFDRNVFFGEYGITSPSLYERARAWALLFGLIYWRSSQDDALMSRMARTVLDQVLPRFTID